MQPAYTRTQSPRWHLSQSALACKEHNLPSKTWVRRQQASRREKKKKVNKQCVGPSQQSELKQGSSSNKRSQTKLAGAALQASTVAEALSLYYREPHTHFYVSLDPNGYNQCDVTRTEEMHTCNAQSFLCFPENPLRRNTGLLGQGTLKRGGKVRKWDTAGVPVELRRRFVLPPGTGVHASMCAWVHQQATVTW